MVLRARFLPDLVLMRFGAGVDGLLAFDLVFDLDRSSAREAGTVKELLLPEPAGFRRKAISSLHFSVCASSFATALLRNSAILL